MAARSIKAIVISNIAFQEHDATLRLLSSNRVYKVYAPGVNKPLSKNRPSTILGTFGDYEIFEARLNNKTSKLKKGVTLISLDYKNPNLQIVYKDIFWSLNKIDKLSKFNFDLLTENWNLLNSDKVFHFRTFILLTVLKELGFEQMHDRCVECQSSENLKDFQFYKGGMICNIHAGKKGRTLEELQALYYLGLGPKTYIKYVSSEIDFYLYKEIKSFIEENIL